MREDWTECCFEDILDYEQPTKYIVNSTDYNDAYEMPVLTAGKSFIKGYTNETEGIFENLPTIIFDDFTTASQYVDFKFKVKSSAMKILVPTSKLVNMRFAFYCMQVNQIRNDTHKRYWISVYAKKKFLLPSLVEQKAIISKIEELFSDLDKGIDDLKKAKDQLVIYRQAVLKKAFEGELTKKWREKQTNLPTADELLKQIKGDFEKLVKENNKKKEKPLLPIKNDDIPHLIPKTWNWCNLGDVSWFINGDRGKNYPNRNEYVSSGIPWINTGHIEPDGSLSSDKMNFITREKFNTLRSGKIQPGDLVYCLRGATFGKTAYVVPYTEGSIASSLMIIRSNEKLNNTYLYHFLTSVEGKKQLQRFDNGTAQPNLSANMVRSYAFPLPSTVEQHQIVREIESRLSVCDKVEQSINDSLEKAKALRQSILRKAFEGTLLSATEIARCKLEKDYEPAAKLLAKIKAERKIKSKLNLNNGSRT